MGLRASAPADRRIGRLVRALSAHVYRDMAQVDELIRASDRDWTIVRVPLLTDAPGGGRLRVGYVGRGVGARLACADLADFMLRQAPAISNERNQDLTGFQKPVRSAAALSSSPAGR